MEMATNSSSTHKGPGEGSVSACHPAVVVIMVLISFTSYSARLLALALPPTQTRTRRYYQKPRSQKAEAVELEGGWKNEEATHCWMETESQTLNTRVSIDLEDGLTYTVSEFAVGEVQDLTKRNRNSLTIAPSLSQTFPYDSTPLSLESKIYGSMQSNFDCRLIT